MTRQASIVKSKGQPGVPFYKSGSGYRTRKKRAVSPEHLASDPSSSKLRGHIADFIRSALAAKLLRKSIKGALEQATESTMIRANEENPRSQ